SSVLYLLYMFTMTSYTHIFNLSLHDALPISEKTNGFIIDLIEIVHEAAKEEKNIFEIESLKFEAETSEQETEEENIDEKIFKKRSEEHTSELQSRFDLVCRLLLEKNKYNV